MTTFVTGATGYIGSYVVTGLLRTSSERLALLVRAPSVAAAHERLWAAIQLHMGFEEFRAALSRIDVYLGDLTSPGLGLEAAASMRLIRSIDSVIHCAASLNRKSSKACFNVNLRGTLEVVKIARAAADRAGLRRFSDVSTVAVCGEHQDAVVQEDRGLDWNLSDYDPYARTKKFCEHMVHELLPEVPITVFRPSIVLGDSRFARTTQFDMVRAFVFLASMPVIPLRPDWRADIVPADYVGRAIVHVHQKDKPRYDTYNLSSGTAALSYRAIVDGLRDRGLRTKPVFFSELGSPFAQMVRGLAATPRGWGVAGPASLLMVFWPYLVFNTVFDNSRICEELGEAPASFLDYALDLMTFAKTHGYRYPAEPWPGPAAERVA